VFTDVYTEACPKHRLKLRSHVRGKERKGKEKKGNYAQG
jgi:hypothetical protein